MAELKQYIPPLIFMKMKAVILIHVMQVKVTCNNHMQYTFLSAIAMHIQCKVPRTQSKHSKDMSWSVTLIADTYLLCRFMNVYVHGRPLITKCRFVNKSGKVRILHQRFFHHHNAGTTRRQTTWIQMRSQIFAKNLWIYARI